MWKIVFYFLKTFFLFNIYILNISLVIGKKKRRSFSVSVCGWGLGSRPCPAPGEAAPSRRPVASPEQGRLVRRELRPAESPSVPGPTQGLGGSHLPGPGLGVLQTAHRVESTEAGARGPVIGSRCGHSLCPGPQEEGIRGQGGTRGAEAWVGNGAPVWGGASLRDPRPCSGPATLRDRPPAVAPDLKSRLSRHTDSPLCSAACACGTNTRVTRTFPTSTFASPVSSHRIKTSRVSATPARGCRPPPPLPCPCLGCPPGNPFPLETCLQAWRPSGSGHQRSRPAGLGRTPGGALLPSPGGILQGLCQFRKQPQNRGPCSD